MKIDYFDISANVMSVGRTGNFGIGSKKGPSAYLLRDEIKNSASGRGITEIVMDIPALDYRWGDGLVAAVTPADDQTVDRKTEGFNQ